MRYIETGLEDVWLIAPEPSRDHRGSFARTFCVREFGLRGLATNFVQHSASHSLRRHTLRGLHFQKPPHEEVKLVSCSLGAIWDVAVDLRAGSPTRGRWYATELSAENGYQLYIPAGCAHGFQTLADDSVTRYLISTYYEPGAAAGLRYDDPALAITWPAEPACISEKDLAWPHFAELEI
jgi:dTDP-4-dehydrorhamnose 3,5-epimerase